MSSRVPINFAMTLGASIGMNPSRFARFFVRAGLMVAILAVLFGSPQSTSGQDMDKATLDKIKEATVFIKIKVGKMQGSGSGFVFKVINNRVLVMTNRHVAVPDEDDLPADGKFALSAVFRSGTGAEQELPAKLIAYSVEEAVDLAVIEVQGLNNIPEPLKADLTVTENEFFETMKVYSMGFPRGAVMAAIGGNAKGNPAVTVNAMSISSLRRDKRNRLSRVQLNGSLIEGNSGGPVVDTKGRLVGVVVERLIGEAVGFAIPPGIIAHFLSGNLSEPILVEVLGSIGPETQVKIVWRLADPLNRIGSTSIRYTTKPIPPDKMVPNNLGGYPEIDGKVVKLTKEPDRVSGTFPVPINSPADRKLYIQFVKYDFAGKVDAVYRPITIPIPDRPGKIHDIEDSEKEKALAKWSCEANLGEGIKITNKPDATTIDVPARPLNNSPQLDLFNAPCALVKVAGDFVTAVVVQNTLDPGSEGIILPNNKKLNYSFQSAGLLIWQDDKNFVRFERSKKSEGGLSLKNQLLVEVYKGGKEYTRYLDIPDVQVLLVIVKKGSTIQMFFAFPPDERVIFDQMVVDFSEEVYVGLAATNLSKRKYQAKFQGFTLIDLEKNPIEVKAAKLSKLVEPAYTKTPDGTFIYEGANLRVMSKDARAVVPQTNMAEFKGNWSDNRQLLWNNEKGDGTLSLELPIEADGKYEIKAKFTLAPDYAIAKLDLEGKPLYKGGKIDFYSAEVKPTALMSLGTMSLSKGKRKLNITVFKKNPKSSGYHFGIDEIQLVPAK